MSNEKGESKRVVLKINVSSRIILRASFKSSFPFLNANIPFDGSRFRSRSRETFLSLSVQIKYLILKFRYTCKKD